METARDPCLELDRGGLAAIGSSSKKLSLPLGVVADFGMADDGGGAAVEEDNGEAVVAEGGGGG